MDNKQLKSLIKLLKSLGVVSYKSEGIELLIDLKHTTELPAPPKHVPGQLASELNRAAPGYMGLSDEEIAMWSAPKDQ